MGKREVLPGDMAPCPLRLSPSVIFSVACQGESDKNDKIPVPLPKMASMTPVCLNLAKKKLQCPAV